MSITAVPDYRPVDELLQDFIAIRDRVNALEAIVYKPSALTVAPSRQQRLDEAQEALRTGIRGYLELGILDLDVLLQSIIKPIADEQLAIAEREGRI